jgi:putative nucleotidyltransferase with HDIG domain
MIKKVKAEQLKPGHFVHDFNCSWLDHPFLRNRIRLRSEQDVEKVIKHGIHEVYIDTVMGPDVDDAPTREEVVKEIDAELRALPDPIAPPENRRFTMKRDLDKAQVMIEEATWATRQLMTDVRLGRPLNMTEVETLVDRLTESVLRNHDALLSLVRIKRKDEYTYMHSLGVAALNISFARYLGFDDRQVKQLGVGGLLHDIGKIKVPANILNKPATLNEKEFEIMKTHVAQGICVLRDTSGVDEESICVTAHHHERRDGTGYPLGLCGGEISLFGRITAIVDIYDALTAERCYKKPLLPTDAIKKLLEWSEHYLDRDLVDKFIGHIGVYPVGTLVRLRSGIVGVVIEQGHRGHAFPVIRGIYNPAKDQWLGQKVIDLSELADHGDPDDIVCCESPNRYVVNPMNCFG